MTNPFDTKTLEIHTIHKKMITLCMYLDMPNFVMQSSRTATYRVAILKGLIWQEWLWIVPFLVGMFEPMF